MNNTNPPRATLFLLGCALTGLVFQAEPLLHRFATRSLVWRATVAVEARMMTVYLWHLTALVILGAGSLWLGGAGLHATPNTQSWWVTRPAWILLLGATAAVLVAVIGRFEDPPLTKAAAARGPAIPLLQLSLLIVLLALLADDGLGDSTRVPEPWLLVLAALAALADSTTC